MDEPTYVEHEPDAVRFLQTIAAAGELRPGTVLVASTVNGGPGVAIAIDDVPLDPPQFSRVRAMRQVMDVLEYLGHDGALLAVSRTGQPAIQGGDLAWHDAFAGMAREHAVAALGVYVVTAQGVRRVRPRQVVVGYRPAG
ncbi:MAG: hypothetical protein ICV70_00535 [Jiangellaceae bacterium]|nr:hypothetical protein [Jiangellaceae bacterium]